MCLLPGISSLSSGWESRGEGCEKGWRGRGRRELAQLPRLRGLGGGCGQSMGVTHSVHP